ncbi:MAG TPA: hypothetical protein VGF45_23150 [Polyangia bacterium]
MLSPLARPTLVASMTAFSIFKRGGGATWAVATTAVIVFCGALGGGCSRTRSALAPAHPALLATDSNRDRLVGHVVVPSLDRTLATAEALRGDGVIPFGANELRQMIQARVNLPAELIDLVDTSKPMNAAFGKVAPAAKPATNPGAAAQEPPPWFAGVISVKSLVAAAEKAKAAGAPAETRKDAQRFVRPDGSSLWVARVEDRVVWSDSFEGLSEAGAHALAAPVENAEDVVATLFPGSFMAGGKLGDLSATAAESKRRALATYENQLRARGQTPNQAERAALDAALDFVLPSLAESERVRIGFGVTRTRGLGLAVRATPRTGSGYAQRLAPRTPYRAPTNFVARASTVSMLASGPNPAWFALGQAVLDKQGQAGVPGASSVAAKYRALMPLLSGATFQSVRSEGDNLAADFAFGLAPAAPLNAAVDAFANLLADPGLPKLLSQAWGQQAPQIELQRQPGANDGRFTVTFNFPPGGRGPGPGALARVMTGGDRLTFLVQPAAGRLLVSSEPNAESRQRTLATTLDEKPSNDAAAAPLGGALSETTGKEGLLYFELWGFARPLLRAFVPGPERRFVEMAMALPGLDTLSLPLWVSVEGGDALTTELRVPLATLKNASTVLGLFGGAGGIPSAARPSPQP